jgi:acyl carrier protein
MTKPSNAKKPAPSRDEIEAWLKQRISTVLKLPLEKIDITEEFASLGMDSRRAVQLSGELETWLGRQLLPTLLLDYPSITLLAEHLSE